MTEAEEITKKINEEKEKKTFSKLLSNIKLYMINLINIQVEIINKNNELFDIRLRKIEAKVFKKKEIEKKPEILPKMAFAREIKKKEEGFEVYE